MTRYTQGRKDGTSVDLPPAFIAFVHQLEEDYPSSLVLASICERDSGAIVYEVTVESVESVTGIPGKSIAGTSAPIS